MALLNYQIILPTCGHFYTSDHNPFKRHTCSLSDAPKPLVFAHLYAHKLEQQENLRPIK